VATDTRAKLIEGVSKAVGRHGLRELTVAQIVKAAGLSRRTFYQYFRDRDQAVNALYQQITEDLVQLIKGRIEEAEDPLERLHAGIDAYLDFQQEGGRLVMEIQAEAANPGSPLHPRRERTMHRLVHIVDSHMQADLAKELDPYVYWVLFLGMEALVIHARQGGPFAPDTRAHVEAVMKPMFINALTGIQAVPDP